MSSERHNPTYLPNARIPDSVEITDDLQAAAEDAGMWVFATPSHAVRSAAERLSTLATPQHLLVSVAKGIENDTLMTTTQVLASVLPARE